MNCTLRRCLRIRNTPGCLNALCTVVMDAYNRNREAFLNKYKDFTGTGLMRIILEEVPLEQLNTADSIYRTIVDILDFAVDARRYRMGVKTKQLPPQPVETNTPPPQLFSPIQPTPSVQKRKRIRQQTTNPVQPSKCIQQPSKQTKYLHTSTPVLRRHVSLDNNKTPYFATIVLHKSTSR